MAVIGRCSPAIRFPFSIHYKLHQLNLNHIKGVLIVPVSINIVSSERMHSVDGRLPYSLIVKEKKKLGEICKYTKIKQTYDCWRVPLTNN